MSVPPPPQRLTRDPESVAGLVRLCRPLVKAWHRSEVRGLDKIPDGGSLLVSNHSGGVLAMDFPVLAVDWTERFGNDRPLYLLAHSVIFQGPMAQWLPRIGLVPASPANALQVLESGAALLVFPGGDFDAARPTSRRNVIDFDGRTGYVRTAIAAGVPIVPVVSIGGQENHLFLTRGRRLADALGLRKLARVSAVPISVGFPFGPSFGMVFPLNAPLPSKIVTQVLEPVDVRGMFGDDPDPAAVDAHVRKVMQAGLDTLARDRAFPVVG